MLSFPTQSPQRLAEILHFRQNCAVAKGLPLVRLVSFNVNGIRARQHQLRAVTDRHSPDILADSDIGIGEDNRKRWLRTGKASFLPKEREWLERLMDWGLTDAFRQTGSEETQHYSWFDYRSRGFEREPRRGLRIDLILASQGLAGSLTGSGIDYEIRGSEKPSDHCPIWAEFDL